MTRSNDCRPGGVGEPAPRGSLFSIPSADRFGRYLLLGLYLLALVFMIRLFNQNLNTGDEGVAIMNGWRVSEGQIPHDDFFEIIPPFSFLPTALFFKLFGVSILAERLLTLIYGMALIVASERLLARFTPNVWARGLVIAFLIPFGVYYLPIPSHHWVADILQVLGLLALDRGLSGPRPWLWGGLAGVLAALSAFSLQDQGGFFLLALLGLFFPWVPDKNCRKRLFGGWVAGGLVVAAAFAAYLLPHVSPSELWNQWVAFPIAHYRNTPGNAREIFGAGKELGALLRGPVIRQYPVFASAFFLGQFVALLLPLFGLLSAALLWRRLGSSRPRVLLLTAGAAAFALAALRRYTVLNAIWGAAVLLILCAWLLAVLWDHERRWLRWSARGLCIGLLTSCLLYAGIGLVYMTPQHSANLRMPIGTLQTGDLPLATQFQQAVDQIQVRVPPSEPMFCRDFVVSLSAMTLHMNPTRYNFILTWGGGYNTLEQGQEWIETLERTHTRWGVSTRYTLDLSDPVDRYLAEKWVPAWSNEGYVLWMRRET